MKQLQISLSSSATPRQQLHPPITPAAAILTQPFSFIPLMGFGEGRWERRKHTSSKGSFPTCDSNRTHSFLTTLPPPQNHFYRAFPLPLATSRKHNQKANFYCIMTVIILGISWKPSNAHHLFSYISKGEGN